MFCFCNSCCLFHCVFLRFCCSWIDVEQCDGCWSGDLDSNCAWIGGLLNQYKAMGINVGIYASPYEWVRLRRFLVVLCLPLRAYVSTGRDCRLRMQL